MWSSRVLEVYRRQRVRCLEGTPFEAKQPPKRIAKKRWSRPPPRGDSWLDEGMYIVCGTGHCRGPFLLVFWQGLSLFLSFAMSFGRGTGDRGASFGRRRRRRMRFGSVKRAGRLGETGGVQGRERKRFASLMGPWEMGPCFFDMCRSWVGWAAVAGVGQGPLQMM